MAHSKDTDALPTKAFFERPPFRPTGPMITPSPHNPMPSDSRTQPNARMSMPRVFSEQDVRTAERFAAQLVGSHLKQRIASVVLDRVPLHAKAFEASKDQIRVLVILDDLSHPFTQQDLHGYLTTVTRLVHAVSNRLHVSTLKLSEHWELCKISAVHHLNTLRYGVALYDRGFFDPMRYLVTKGRVRPSIESEGIFATRALNTLNGASHHILQATLDLYWACIDACHAALMKQGELPPEPADVAKTLDRVLVSRRLLEPEYPRIMEMMYELSRGILHRTIRDIPGQDYDKYLAQATKLVRRMEQVCQARHH